MINDVITDDYKLLFGDCLERMKEIPDCSVDAIICDPPYGTVACKWDNIIPFDKMWNELNRIIKPDGAIVLFGSEPFSSMLRVSNITDYKYDIIWEKQKPSNFQLMKYQVGKVHEIISIFSKYASSFVKSGNVMKYNPQMTGEAYDRKTKIYGNNENITLRDNSLYDKCNKVVDKKYTGKMPRSVVKFNVDILNKLHPTQKPIDLMEYLIKTYSNDGDTVLDFTMGSGSTGAACLNTNRKFIGIELDEKYFQICIDRMGDI